MAYVGGLWIHRLDRAETQKLRKAVFIVTCVLLVGNLFIFKYLNFTIDNIELLLGRDLHVAPLVLPIGISFYTFQILSYVIDLYRHDVHVQKNYFYLTLYVSFFPQLIAGPIVRYQTIEDEILHRKESLRDITEGSRRFIIGLSKKVLLANTVANISVIIYEGSTAAWGTSIYWIAAISYALQIYFDFSGYSDMAIGLGRILGFHFPENFRYPYCAGSITEFWRRWHISLGSWFRDYLYIPLGGNRKGKGRQLLNILLVWLATGLWHGADWTFVLWGLLYAALLTAEKLFLLRGLKKLRVLNHIYVLLFVTLGFVLFDADSVRSAAASVCAMFGGGGLPLAGQESLYALRSGAVLLLSAAVGATPLPRRLITAVQQKQAGRAVLAVLEPVGLCLLLAVCTAFLVDGSFNPFLYFRF